jgi:hypothetical protein
MRKTIVTFVVALFVAVAAVSAVVVSDSREAVVAGTSYPPS